MCFSGEPTEKQLLVTPEQEKIQRMLSVMLNRGSATMPTPYGGPIASQPDQLQLGGADIMAKLMGQGQYQMPGFMGMQNLGTTMPSGAPNPNAPATPVNPGGGGGASPLDMLRKRYTPQGY